MAQLARLFKQALCRGKMGEGSEHGQVQHDKGGSNDDQDKGNEGDSDDDN